MLIPCYAMLPLYYGSRKKIIGRPGHYGDIIPLGLKVYFLLVVAMTAPVPVGRRALHGPLYSMAKRRRGSPMKITASAPEPYSVNDWQTRIDDSSSPALGPEHITRVYRYRRALRVRSMACFANHAVISLSLSLIFSSSSMPQCSVCSSSCIPLDRASPFHAHRGLLSRAEDRRCLHFTFALHIPFWRAST